MGNNNELLSKVMNLLNNVDMNQIESLLSGFTSNNKKANTSESIFGKLDLNNIKESLSKLGLGGQKNSEGQSSLMTNNPGIIGGSPLLNSSGLDSIISDLKKNLEALRNFKF